MGGRQAGRGFCAMNKYFSDVDIAEAGIFFMCYMSERVVREAHQPNKMI